MPTAMVTFNGRITLPNQVRKQLGVKPGDAVEFIEDGSGQFAISRRPRSRKAEKSAKAAGGETASDTTEAKA